MRCRICGAPAGGMLDDAVVADLCQRCVDDPEREVRVDYSKPVSEEQEDLLCDLIWAIDCGSDISITWDWKYARQLLADYTARAIAAERENGARLRALLLKADECLKGHMIGVNCHGPMLDPETQAEWRAVLHPEESE